MSPTIGDATIEQSSIPFNNLKEQLNELRPTVEAAIAGVLNHGKFILGPEVERLEGMLAQFASVRHAITCANGTDALALALMAIRIKPSDAIFVPSFTFAATAEPLCTLGGVPVFVDVLPDTFNMDSQSLIDAIALSRRYGLKPRAIIAVDLFGQPADYVTLESIAKSESLTLVCDAAQSFGASLSGRKVGTFGTLTTTSFFPAKPLGCYGDGGAVFTNDDDLADTLRSLRVHGQGIDKYDNVRIGTNSRLDTIQAAILLAKLEVFADEISSRNFIAERYERALTDVVRVPKIAKGARSTWAQYTIRHSSRDRLAEVLGEQGIPTAIYYRRPLHLQPAYERFVLPGQDHSASECAAREVLSLPMSAYLNSSDQERITAAILDFVESPSAS
jgi:dTDP-4-amino-4,6-dideoxygalactose transaminase